MRISSLYSVCLIPVCHLVAFGRLCFVQTSRPTKKKHTKENSMCPNYCRFTIFLCSPVFFYSLVNLAIYIRSGLRFIHNNNIIYTRMLRNSPSLRSLLQCTVQTISVFSHIVQLKTEHHTSFAISALV